MNWSILAKSSASDVRKKMRGKREGRWERRKEQKEEEKKRKARSIRKGNYKTNDNP